MLLVDIGNSRIKWALGERPGDWRASGACARADMDQLAVAWRGLAARSVFACNVAGPDVAVRLAALARQSVGREPRMVVAQAAGHGVTNRYGDPASLGADRWAALVGAHALVRGPVCVVDCGTAVTVDGLDADGHFDGGAIFPGLALCARALGAGTHGIGVGAGSHAGFPGRTTADGVATGVHHGVAAAIDGLVGRYCEFLGGQATVVLTGGDAHALQPLLRRTVQIIPDLVLRGLAVIAGAAA